MLLGAPRWVPVTPSRAQVPIPSQQEAQELWGGSSLARRGCRATSPGEGWELMGPLEAHLGHAGPSRPSVSRVLKHDWGDSLLSILTACVQLLW